MRFLGAHTPLISLLKYHPHTKYGIFCWPTGAWGHNDSVHLYIHSTKLTNLQSFALQRKWLQHTANTCAKLKREENSNRRHCKALRETARLWKHWWAFPPLPSALSYREATSRSSPHSSPSSPETFHSRLNWSFRGKYDICASLLPPHWDKAVSGTGS